MRKTYISRLLNERYDADFVRVQAGHKELATTLNHYDFATTRQQEIPRNSTNPWAQPDLDPGFGHLDPGLKTSKKPETHINTEFPASDQAEKEGFEPSRRLPDLHP